MIKIRIVKPWSKSESKPLSQQTPKLNKSPPKNEKRRIWTLGWHYLVFLHGPPPHPTPPVPKLLSMKECSGKEVLIVKVAQNDPLDLPSKKNGPGGQWDQGHGVVLHVQEEVYRSTLTFRRRVDRYQEWSIQQKKWPGGHQEQGHGVVPQVQEEGYQSTLTFRRRVAKYHRVSVRCPKKLWCISPSTKHKRGVKSQR